MATTGGRGGDGAGDGIDWDAAYDNSATVADVAAIVAGWEAAAATFRDGLAARGWSLATLAYGADPRQTLDLFTPADAPAGLAVFLHGGYWRRFDRAAWSHLAEAPLAEGWAVAIPSYRLAPQARIAEITRDAAAAIATAAERVEGPIALSGHSAGGHLATRMLCRDAPLAPALLARVARALSISGVHDLRPLTRTAMNETLRIDAAEAEAESPALLAPVADAPRVLAAVGGAELPAFQEQARALVAAWSRQGVAIRERALEGKNHYDVLDALRPGGLLARWLLDAEPDA